MDTQSESTAERRDDRSAGPKVPLAVGTVSRAERDRFVALAFCWADLLLELDSARRVVYAAGATDSLLGRESGELLGMPVGNLIAARDRQLFEELLKVAARRGRITNARIDFLRRGGRKVPLALAGYCLEDLGNHFYLALRAKVPAVHAAGKVLGRDDVSGLFDGDSFLSMALHRIAGMKAANEDVRVTFLSIAELDALRGRIDREAERDLLHTLGACLRAHSVDGDSAGRLGSDRFGLVHDRETDTAFLGREIEDLSRRKDPQGRGIGIRSATLEVDHGRIHDTDLVKGLTTVVEDVRSHKDPATVLSKVAGPMSRVVEQVGDSLAAFRRMVEAGTFGIAFQPIIDVHTGRTHHFEALARFSLAGAESSPAPWIARAEEAGIIPDFDLAMVRRVTSWLDTRRIERHYHVAVNISGYSLESGSFVGKLLKLLRENIWLRGRMMFEITETTRISDLQRANSYIQALRKLGFVVCLDDFGAGAADFNYLSSLEVDLVKFDGLAVAKARQGGKGQAFLKALTGLCGELGVETVAEMIDSKAGLEFVRAAGVGYVQGYLFGEPCKDIEMFARVDHSFLFPGTRR